MLGWLREGCDEKQLDEIQKALDKAAWVPHPLVTPVPVLKLVESKPDESSKGVKLYKKWTAPEGWTPPGWKSDESAYRNAKSAMGFIGTKK